MGRDQVQHIEMARDFGQRFNHLYGEHFVLPEAAIEEHVATLPGLDGRKMSKSYDNTIPLFAPREQLKKLIFAHRHRLARAGRSRRTREDSALFQLYQAFAIAEEAAAMRQAFADGIAWGDAKQQLFERIDREVAPLREKYEALMAEPDEIEALLRDGAQRLRAQYATPLHGATARSGRPARPVARNRGAGAKRANASARAATFKQYREADGQFYFKLVDGDRVLLQSEGFESARDAGQLVARAKQDGGPQLRRSMRRGRRPLRRRRARARAAGRQRRGPASPRWRNSPRRRVNPFVELNLAAILFLPWFAILGVLYWLYPRQPRPAWRKWFDLRRAGGLGARVRLAACTGRHGLGRPGYGRMWQQIVGDVGLVWRVPRRAGAGRSGPASHAGGPRYQFRAGGSVESPPRFSSRVSAGKPALHDPSGPAAMSAVPCLPSLFDAP